jgi:hypothetical protein
VSKTQQSHFILKAKKEGRKEKSEKNASKSLTTGA